jgi:hypothetical protein
MKIIGKTDGGLIITASRDEIAKLMGHRSAQGNILGKKLKVGNEIKVAKMYNQLRDLRNQNTKISETIKSLSECQDTLQSVESMDICCEPDEE